MPTHWVGVKQAWVGQSRANALQVVYSYEERESLLKLLIEHVTANLVKVSGQHMG